MSSVTQRIKEIKQPKGGYLKSSEFRVIDLNDGKELNSEENVHGSVIGMVVDYMSRYMTGTNLAKSFNISILGAAVAEKMGREESIKEIDRLNEEIEDNNRLMNDKYIHYLDKREYENENIYNRLRINNLYSMIDDINTSISNRVVRKLSNS